MTVNEKIKKYLIEHGIKQAFLVEKTGMTRGQVSNIMANKRNISASELILILNALNLDVNFFS